MSRGLLHCHQTGKFRSVFPAAVVKGKKGRKGNGEEKVKRSITAYNLFIRYKVEELKGSGLIPPNSKITDTIRELGAEWSKLEPAAKAAKSKMLFMRHQKENPDFVMPADMSEVKVCLQPLLPGSLFGICFKRMWLSLEPDIFVKGRRGRGG